MRCLLKGRYLLVTYITVAGLSYAMAQNQGVDMHASNSVNNSHNNSAIELDGQIWHFESLPQAHSEHESPAHVGECYGYLTSDPTEGFCAKELPADWTELEFNGLTVYKVPLAAPDRSALSKDQQQENE